MTKNWDASVGSSEYVIRFGESSAVFQWYLHLGGVFAIVGSLLFGHYIGRLEESFYVVMGVLAVLLVVMSYREAHAVEKQVLRSEEEAKLLNQIGDMDDFFRQSSGTQSLFREHVKDLLEIARRDRTVNQDVLIEAIQVRMLARNRQILSLGNVLIMLGLLGTMVGLMGMTDSLSDVLGNEAVMQDPALMVPMLTDEETGPFRDLGTAFMTTILGMLGGGILMRMLCSQVEESICEFIAHLSKLTEVYVLPLVRREAEVRHGAVT